ncbi:hypothetical protein TRFO_13319 [Tritrichomonas foetus]|uniref:Uncharacterized protein n=1 Tax=Tritrichomonas foetus TaxID=1144522 RepID=A0A1J4KYS2_9EUKA|nr:hypothetical protein TRFO_13319 [Tritrichomonas foetus]|eukprot:OHT16306.1 hypothetical protein TRFO_13319 [Tritrichomonas foetus]
MMYFSQRKEALKFFGTNRSEFEMKLRNMGITPSEDEISQMIQELQNDADFSNMENVKQIDNENLLYAFRIFQENDIIMTKDELNIILNYHGVDVLEDSQREEILRKCIKNEFNVVKLVEKKFNKNNGLTNFESFYNV